MKPIGGYFELELQKGNQTFHSTPAFKSGRAALHYILKAVRPKNVYIPFYTCDALLEPFERARVPYQFYGLNAALEPVVLPELKKDEYFLYIHYFGLQDKAVEKLVERYGDRLILDCSQAFYYKRRGSCWIFNSCRKFFGVPDGSFLYSPQGLKVQAPEEKNKNYTIEHLLQRFHGAADEGYNAFVQNEKACNSDIKAMSQLSEHLLSHVDFEACGQKRKENFLFFQEVLGSSNELPITLHNDAVPMVYPLLPRKKIKHRQLWAQNLFVPWFWKDVVNRNVSGFEKEKQWAENLLPLPIDHRYSTADMQYLADSINAL